MELPVHATNEEIEIRKQEIKKQCPCKFALTVWASPAHPQLCLVHEETFSLPATSRAKLREKIITIHAEKTLHEQKQKLDDINKLDKEE